MTDAPASPPQEPKPETHKPRWVRDWRVLLTELAIVVLGVGLALAAQQAAEWWNWRSKVAEARGIIASEMAINVDGAIARIGSQTCTENRLDEVGRILDEAARTGALPPVGDIGLPPLRSANSGAWQSLVASDTAAHFSRAELAELAQIYYFIDRLNNYHPLQNQAWYELAAMVGPGRRLDPASEAELRKALQLARGYGRSMTQLSINLVTALEPHNLPYSADDLARIAAARRQIAGAIPGNTASSFRTCQPLPAAPPQYGQMTGFSVSADSIAKALTLVPGGTIAKDEP